MKYSCGLKRNKQTETSYKLKYCVKERHTQERSNIHVAIYKSINVRKEIKYV